MSATTRAVTDDLAKGATPMDAHAMSAAIEQARKAAAIHEVPVGAVVYRGTEIIAAAHNLREAHQDPTAHAEIIALRAAAVKLNDWRLTGCTLVVTLEPCPMCAGAIVNARLDRLVYGASDPKAGAVRTLFSLCSDERLNHRVQIVHGVLAPQCRGLLRDFFKERRVLNRDRRLSERE